MGFWDTSVALPLQKTTEKVKQPVRETRQVVRSRFDDERIITDNIMTICDELIATEIVMMVTKKVLIGGALVEGTEQLWESKEKGIRVYKRIAQEDNTTVTRVETSLNINSRQLNISAEFYDGGGSFVQQHPDGFNHSGAAFTVADDQTKRVIKRRLLSRLSVIAAQSVAA